jgi:hypothetical protein
MKRGCERFSHYEEQTEEEATAEDEAAHRVVKSDEEAKQ